MRAFNRWTGTVAVLDTPDIDTDQIIPARFLGTTSREGLGSRCFADWRFDSEGRVRPDFPLTRTGVRDASILVAGHNFGCGSSREHAAWALADMGFRVIISTRLADIFRSNALKNGLLAIDVSGDTWRMLAGRIGSDVTVDLEAGVIQAPGMSDQPFEVEPFARRCLLQGVDPLGYLLALDDTIGAYESRRDGSLTGSLS